MVNEGRIKYAAQNLKLDATTKIACDHCRTQGKTDFSLSVTNKGDHCVYKCHRCEDVAGRIKYDNRPPPAPREESVTKQEATEDQRTAGVRWLEDERKIPYEPIKNFVEFGSAYFRQARQNLPCIEFVFKNEEGRRVYSKFRAIKEKHFTSGTSVPGGTDTLYLTESVDISKPYLIITEGELDALVLKALGMNVVSMPTGANVKWLAHNQNLLRKFRMVLIWFDADAKGGTVADKLKQANPSLTKNFRYIVPAKLEALHPGCKDANDIAKAVALPDLEPALKKVCNECFERYVPPYVIRPDDVAKSLVRIRDNTYANKIGIEAPALDEIMSMTPGYAGIITGVPGMGKTSMLSWYAYKRANIYGHKTVFWSPENDPALLYADLIGLAAGKVIQGHAGSAALTDLEIKTYSQFVSSHFRIVQDSEDAADIDSILNKMLAASNDMGGAEIFVIDPFNFIKLPETKNQLDAVRVVFSKIRRFAVDNNCFCALVAHPKKQNERESKRPTSDDDSGYVGEQSPIKKYEMPGMYSISGSADFANMADLIVTVHREDTHTVIATTKSRRPFLGRVGTCNVLFRPESGRFTVLSRSANSISGYSYEEPF